MTTKRKIENNFQENIWCGHCKKKIDSQFYIVEGNGKYKTSYHVKCFKLIYGEETGIEEIERLEDIFDEFET